MAKTVDGSIKVETPAFSMASDAIGKSVKEAGVALSDIHREDSEPVIVTDGVMDDKKLADKIRKGKWYQIVIHRQGSGSPDDMKYTHIPNYIGNMDYTIWHEVPTWVPEYVVNILKESRRMETTYNRVVDNGQPRMYSAVEEMQCHPFTIEKESQGKPENGKAVGVN